MNVAIAQRLAALRREHGLTQEQLAERIGVSRQAVSKWERTESSPDTDNLIALARLYGVTLDELLYGAGTGEALDEGPEAAGDLTAAGSASAPKAGVTAAGGPAPVDLSPREGEEPEVAAVAGDPSSMASGATQAAGADGAQGVGDRSGVPDDADAPAAVPGDDPFEPGPEDADDVGGAGSAAASSTGGRSECWWDDGLHVDSGDASVSVGWDGVVVDDYRSGDHVEVGPGGIHVNASDGKHTVRTEEDGSVWLDGVRYSSWADAHRATRHPDRPRAFISRIPYVPVALIAFVVLGILGHWDVGGTFLAIVPVWGSLCSVANARVRGSRLRGPVAGLCFWAGLSAFLVTGLLAGAWHPAWLLVVGGLVLSILVGALWPRRGDEGTGAAKD